MEYPGDSDVEFIVCINCDGSGWKICGICSGTGINFKTGKKCGYCDGQKMIKCGSCEGRGHRIVRKN